MRHLRTLGLLLLAVFAIGAVTAGGASAAAFQPEWGRCEHPTTYNEETEEYEVFETGGKYTDSGCTVKAKKPHGEYQGAYEWTPLARKDGGAWLEPSSTKVKFETKAGVKIECSHVEPNETNILVGPAPPKPSHQDTPLWALEGCQSEGVPCTTISIGSEPGNISNKLNWLEENGREWQQQLGYIQGNSKPGTNPTVGFELSDHNTETGEAEPLFTPISCEEPGKTGEVTIGSNGPSAGNNGLIGTIAPLNHNTREMTLTYSQSTAGIQAPQRFTKGKPTYLTAEVHNEREPVAMTAEIHFEMGNRELKATK